jgi:hypothetical protein
MLEWSVRVSKVGRVKVGEGLRCTDGESEEAEADNDAYVAHKRQYPHDDGGMGSLFGE